MAFRLQEVHPQVAHLPISFIPAALIADTIGALTGNQTLLRVGRFGIALGAGSALLAGFTGLIAQEEVHAHGEARDMLVTHRNVNAGLAAVLTGMALRRVMTERPTWRYLAFGFSGIAAMLYAVYLGGHMVYEHGVGVRAAGGLRADTPELRREEARRIARRSAHDAAHGLRHAADEVARGEIAPALREHGAKAGLPAT